MKYDEFLKQQKKTKVRHPPRHQESQIQRNIVQWFRMEYPTYMIAAVPNGGYRTTAEARIMKSEGVLAGFSDLIIIADKNILFVEVKTSKGRQSDTQKEFQKNVERLGFQYRICRSLSDFILIVEKWLKERYEI